MFLHSVELDVQQTVNLDSTQHGSNTQLTFQADAWFDNM